MFAKGQSHNLLRASLALAIVLFPAGTMLRSAPARAETEAEVLSAGFIVDFFGKRSGRPQCYARTYDAEHLRAHPRQRLVSMSLTGAGYGRMNELRYAFRLRSLKDHFTGLAVCRPHRKGAHCLVEGDGGDFSLAPATAGLRLAVGRKWTVEGANGFSPDLARGGDDRIVLLRRAQPAACGIG
jgi:hypothetical protein